MQQERYKLRRPEIVFQNVEGDSIAVHLESGNYYSFNNTATIILESLDRGAPVETVLEAFVSTVLEETEAARTLLFGFIQELCEEGILERDESSTTAPALRLEFTAKEVPQYECYTDMQEFLLLDPIHEVAPSGWPKRGDHSE